NASGTGDCFMTTPAKSSFALRLWLPGYHTPSGNKTIGKHWSKVHKMRKPLAAALYEAMREIPVRERTECHKVAYQVLTKMLMGVPLEKRKGKKPAKPTVPARLRIERVTLSLCDEDNFKGGTKALVDCLRYAFPTVLLDDAPGYVVMEHVQTQCGSKCEKGTWVDLAAGEEPEKLPQESAKNRN
ncbi:MAG: hypothetical protein WAW39_16100, partial [Prosthecobacter sp.]|uniref:hypothetical protein n=1 Tax=Prosthecobacter sp. TaxID=1965333 RepID=UPI003BB0FD14